MKMNISSNPLFSSIVSLYTLILLYFPDLFLRIVFSPVLIITGILLLTLLRLGATQRLEYEVKENTWQSRTDPESNENKEKSKEIDSVEPEQTDFLEEEHNWVTSQSETEIGFDPDRCFEDSFVEWNVRAPLEVIYEEGEGEEEEDDDDDPNPKPNGTRNAGTIERYPSLSRYYPESDSDDSSDGEFPSIGEWDLPERTCFTWDEEDREGLIEIALDGSKRGLGFHVEEENLIEIDISPTRNKELFGKKLRLSDEVRFG